MAVQIDSVAWTQTADLTPSSIVRLRPFAAALVPAVDLMALTLGLRLASGASLLDSSYVALTVVVLALSGSYRSRISPHLSRELPDLLARLAVPVVVLGALFRHSPDLPGLLAGVPVAVLLVLAGRAASYGAIRNARAKGELVERTLIIGSGRLGVEVAQTLRSHPEYGLVPVGFLDGFDGTDLPVPLLGDIHDLEPVLAEFDVRRVIVAFGAHREAAMVRVLRACDRADVEVHVLPRFFELGVSSGSRESDDVWGIPLVRVKRAALRTASWRAKRVFDLVLASFGVVLLSPVLAACALAVRLTSKGPVFFRQKRVGQRGQIVEVLKFRTLLVNDDSDTTWAVSDEERFTGAGGFLRRTSLDELPQLLNVIKGDMSLVGPRPERPFFVDRFNVTVDRYDDRHRVPVGITGWAQIHGLRGDTSIDERARFDNHYIEQWSLWGDIVILFRTVTAVVRQALLSS